MKTCSRCNETKPRNEFPSNGWQRLASGDKFQTFKPQCKLCFNAMAKERMAKLFEGLELKCVKCGYSDCVDALDLHHRDPAEKEFNLSSRWSISEEKFKAELAKCVVLCCRCHRELHAGLFNL